MRHLTWLPHINNVTRKISKSIGIIFKANFCLPQQALKTLYYSLVYSYIQYCVSVWGSTYPTNLNRLVVLQKNVVRIIARKPHDDAHTDPIFKNLEILKFNCVELILKSFPFAIRGQRYLTLCLLIFNFLIHCLPFHASYINFF